MKGAFRISWNIYQFLFLVYSIIFWILIVFDDWIFIRKYGSEHWFTYLGGWTLWWLIFGIGLSLYYWGISSTLIVVYYKLIKSKKKNNATNTHLEKESEL